MRKAAEVLRRGMKRLALAVVVALALSSWCTDRSVVQELNRKIRTAAGQRDWSAMRAALIELGQQLPAPTPVYMLRMASVESRLGNTDAAIQWLARYAATGLKYEVRSDEDLKALADTPQYRQIESAMHDRSAPISRTQEICKLPIVDLMPEDITFDPHSGAFITSSVQHHCLYRVRLPKNGIDTCAVDELPMEDWARGWPILAVSLDSKRKRIWATAAALPGFSEVSGREAGKTALFALDNETGQIIRRFDLVTDGPGEFGDMCVAGDGTVYVSDNIGGGVYRVHGDLKTASLEKIADGLFSPQTPTLAADGRRLFVADYSIGIAVIELGTPAARKLGYLPHPDNVAVTGLDGLYRFGDSLIGIQNGTEPERIMRFRLNRQQTRITSAEVIEQSTKQLGEPTHAVLVGGRFYVSANVGWEKIDDHGQLRNGGHFTPPVLLSFPAHEQAACRGCRPAPAASR